MITNDSALVLASSLKAGHHSIIYSDGSQDQISSIQQVMTTENQLISVYTASGQFVGENGMIIS